MARTFTLPNDGFYGYFAEGSKHPQKAIIYMTGADGHEKTAVESSKLFIRHGYSVLTLGFVKWRGLPKDSWGIPVEYVERAARWLLSYKDNLIEKVGIIGSSTGAAYALLCASLLPDITCVVGVSPYDHVLEGTVPGRFARTGKSIYTYKGNDIPFTPLDILDHVKTLKAEVRKNPDYGLLRAMRYGYDHIVPSPESRIRVENINGRVLLLAPENDDMWCSEVATRRMEKVFQENNFPHKYECVVYDKASHLLGNVKLKGLKYPLMFKLMLPAERKHPLECRQARTDSTDRMLRFIEEW
jgi:pimeloyl-ACP methyl ester carboxylesterase